METARVPVSSTRPGEAQGQAMRRRQLFYPIATLLPVHVARLPADRELPLSSFDRHALIAFYA
jgi:hypothetical protein